MTCLNEWSWLYMYNTFYKKSRVLDFLLNLLYDICQGRFTQGEPDGRQ